MVFPGEVPVSEHATERQVPLILIGVGLVCYAIAAFAHAGTNGVAAVLLIVTIGAIFQTFLLILAAFVVATILKISFGDFKSAILKFAGAALAAGGLGAIIPVGGIVASVVFLGLIIWLFELEVPYAIALTVVYFLMAFVIAIGVRSALT
jgi:hypothetical protein